MPGSASFMPLMTPWRLTSSVRRVVASSSSRKRPTGMIPALFTSTASGPAARSAACRNFPNEVRVRTSSASPTASRPTSSAAARAASRSRSPSTTRAPRAANAAAVARPIPRAAPVTATAAPSSSSAPIASGELGLEREVGQQRVAGVLAAARAPEHLAEVRARDDLDKLVANRANHDPRIALDGLVVDHQNVAVAVERARLDARLEVECGEALRRGTHAIQRPQELRWPARAAQQQVVPGPRQRVEALASPRQPGGGQRGDRRVEDRVDGEGDQRALGLPVDAARGPARAEEMVQLGERLAAVAAGAGGPRPRPRARPAARG